MTTMQIVGAVYTRCGGMVSSIGRPSTVTFDDFRVRIVQRLRPVDGTRCEPSQRLLTCSYSGKVLAVRRVTEDAGRKPQE